MILRIDNRTWLDPVHVEAVEIIERGRDLIVFVRMASGRRFLLPRQYPNDQAGEVEAENDMRALLGLLMRAKREPDIVSIADARPNSLHLRAVPPLGEVDGLPADIGRYVE